MHLVASLDAGSTGAFLVPAPIFRASSKAATASSVSGVTCS